MFCVGNRSWVTGRAVTQSATTVVGLATLRKMIPDVMLRFERTIPLSQGTALRADALCTQASWDKFCEGVVKKGVGRIRLHTAEEEQTATRRWVWCGLMVISRMMNSSQRAGS